MRNAGVELGDAIREADGEGAGGVLDRFDDASFSVADVDAGAVALDDDVVACGEASAADDELVVAEPARGAHDGAGASVELADVGSVMRDHQGAVRVVGGVPVAKQLVMHLVGSVADADAPVGFVAG